MLDAMEKSSAAHLISSPDQDKGRNKVAQTLIKSFNDVKGISEYKYDPRYINPDLAADLLKLIYHGQRNLKLDMVNTLTNAMLQKKSYSPNNIIALSYNPDRPTDSKMIALLNGQHTLNAIIKSNTTQPLVVALFPCRSKAEMEFHYSLFDQGRKRSQQDVSRAAGLWDEISKKNLPPKALDTLGSAAKLIRAHLIDTREGGKDKLGNAKLSREWLDEAVLAYRLITPPKPKKGVEPLNEYGKMVRKRLASPLLLPILMVALRSHPDETEITIQQILECADSLSQNDGFMAEVVDYIISMRTSNGSDRRIGGRNFIHLMVALRNRMRTGEGPQSVSEILIDSTPTVKESTELWDILTEDRLPRSVTNI